MTWRFLTETRQAKTQGDEACARAAEMTLPRGRILCTLAIMLLPKNEAHFAPEMNPSVRPDRYTILYHSIYTIRVRKWVKMGSLLRLTQTLESPLAEEKAVGPY